MRFSLNRLHPFLISSSQLLSLPYPLPHLSLSLLPAKFSTVLCSSELYLMPRSCEHTETSSLPSPNLHPVLSRTSMSHLSRALHPSQPSPESEHRLLHALGLLHLHPVLPLHPPPPSLPSLHLEAIACSPKLLRPLSSLPIPRASFTASYSPAGRGEEKKKKTEWRQHSHSFQEAAAEEFRCSRMMTFNPPFCLTITPHKKSTLHSDPEYTHIN